MCFNAITSYGDRYPEGSTEESKVSGSVAADLSWCGKSGAQCQVGVIRQFLLSRIFVPVPSGRARRRVSSPARRRDMPTSHVVVRSSVQPALQPAPTRSSTSARSAAPSSPINEHERPPRLLDRANGRNYSEAQLRLSQIAMNEAGDMAEAERWARKSAGAIFN